VPGVGDLPLVGTIFRKVTDIVERQEVVLLITVHMVDPRHTGTDQLTSRLLQRYVTPMDGIGMMTAPPRAAVVPATTKGGVK
jgi:Flp pilus assembly secretin CpaC